MTFREVLQREMHKIETANKAEPSSAPSPESSSQNPMAANFDDLLHALPFVGQHLFRSQKTAYAQKAPKAKPAKPKEKVRKTDPVVLISELEPLELAALETLKRHSSEGLFKDCISLSGLNRVYRRLARQHHPDLNPEGSTAVFQYIQEAKLVLSGRLKKVQSSAKSDLQSA